MKKLLVFLLLFVSGFAYAQPPESLVHSETSYVNDFGNVFNESQRQELDGMMRSFHDTVQITIVTVNTLQGIAPVDYAVKVGDKWGVGSHSNNGLLILICVPEHQFFAVTGGGIQGELTDLQCGEYYRDIAKPQYKDGNYFDGTKAVLAKYIDILSPSAREYRAKQESEEAVYNQKKTSEMLSDVGYIVFFVIIAIVVILGIRRYLNKKREKEIRVRAVEEQALREFNKIKDRYLTCYREVQKLSETLTTSPFKTEADTVKEHLTELIPTVFVENPAKEVMEAYIEKYNSVVKDVKPLIDDINKKTSILSDSKKIIDSNNDVFLQQRNQQIQIIETGLTDLVFSKGDYVLPISLLRNYIESVKKLVSELVIAYNEYNIPLLLNLNSEVNKIKDDYQSGYRALQSILDSDAEKVKVGRTGKDTLISQIAQYQSYCGKQGVSTATNTDIKQKCQALLEQVNHQFTDNVVDNYAIYNMLVKLLPELGQAKKEYDIEQARLQKIKEEEERKRRDEERKRKDEEDRIRRKKQQDDDDERRRQSSYSSSMNSGGGFNSGGNDVSFGGGSFNGGGGGGSW